MRAFASGCTALTGVEAVSNGVPAFEKPKSRNAAATLVIMGVLSITMFAGITALAIASHVHMAEDTANLIGFPAGAEQRTAISQIGIATFGETVPFYLLQAFTAAILILAANTAFNGFPVLSSLLGRDNYLPHQLANRGDRLVFSNGIVLLALVAGLLIVAFDADVTRLIQLYILGVFLSFTLSQAGMVRHWTDLLHGATARSAAPAPQAAGERHRRRGHRVRLRDRAGDQVRPRGLDRGGRRADPVRRDEGGLAPLRADRGGAGAPAAGVTLPSRVHSVVLVSNLLAPTLRALAFAEATSPATLRAVKVAAEEADDPLPREWEERGVPGAAGGDRVALPRDGAPGASLRAPAAARVSRGRDLDRDPRVRRRPLVGASAAQPDRPEAEGQAAVRALGRGHQRALGARRQEDDPV